MAHMEYKLCTTHFNPYDIVQRPPQAEVFEIPTAPLESLYYNYLYSIQTKRGRADLVSSTQVDTPRLSYGE
jgi:hypothetical protein